MNFIGGATSLDSCLKAYKTSEIKGFFPYERFDHPTKCEIQNFPRMMLSTVSFAAATLSKPNTQIMLTYWKVDWPQNKPLSNWNCQSHPLLELRIFNTCNRYGGKNKLAHSRNFCGGITKRCCANFGSNAKNNCLLPRQRYRYDEAWLYITKLG